MNIFKGTIKGKGMMKSTCFAMLAAAAVLSAGKINAAETVSAADGTFATRVARWSGDAKGAYALYYDDGTASALELAAPVLVKYGVPGSFYICFGWFEKNPAGGLAWIDFARRHMDTIRLANHTWSHCGATNYEHAVKEIGRNADYIRKGLGLPGDARISFARPGGVPWKLTPEEVARVLAETRCDPRPDDDKVFTEGRVGGKTHLSLADAVRDMDSAEKNGTFEKLLMHGVGGDWFRFPAGEHELIVRELARRHADGRLWTGASMDVQDYEKERDGAKVKGVEAAKDGFVVDLACSTDAAVYRFPLTLVTSVPENVDSVAVSQGKHFARFPAVGGRAVYDVLPISGPVKVEFRYDVRKK